MLKLHGYDRSPFAWKVRIVLAEKNVPYEQVAPPSDKDGDPQFARLNPFRLTPVLELGGGRVLYESTVICEYLEEAHPQPPMLPRDPFERARVRQLEDTSDQYLYPAMRSFVTAQFDYEPPVLRRKKAGEVKHGVLEESRAKIREHLARLEHEVGKRTWFGGDVFSLADAALVPSLMGAMKLHGFLPEAKLPNLEAWTERAGIRPSLKAAAPKVPTRIE